MIYNYFSFLNHICRILVLLFEQIHSTPYWVCVLDETTPLLLTRWNENVANGLHLNVKKIFPQKSELYLEIAFVFDLYCNFVNF